MKNVAYCICTISLVTLVISTSAGAGTFETIDCAQSWTIDSKILGENRTVAVSTPSSYGTGSEHYPVLYLTDGPAHFEHVSATAEFLASAGRMPEMIVVAVSNTDRNRDLTPTRATMTRPDGSPARYPTSGGADRFIDFLATELMPFIESSYRTQPFKVLAGHSLGGLFAVHVLLTQPDLFGAYIAISPALPWDDELMLRKAKEVFSSRERLQTTLVITMGSEPRLQESYDRFVAFLDSTEMPEFNWNSRKLADEDHRSVALLSNYFGLREIYEGWRMPTNEHTGVVLAGFEALLRHSAELSTKYGYEILPTERQVRKLGRQAQLSGDLESAVEIFRYNIAQHPESSWAYGSLGGVLERQGKLEQALENYKKAADLAERNGDARLNVFKENVKRVEEKITPRRRKPHE